MTLAMTELMQNYIKLERWPLLLKKMENERRNAVRVGDS